jgi:sporadic carbohydrate cluster 2OG-Fe(II) oxygenase
MSLADTFYDSADQALVDEFLEQGYVIVDVDDRAALDEMRHEFVKAACAHMKVALPADDDAFLNSLHEVLPVEKLNDLRLGLYRGTNEQPWFRPTYFGLARRSIEALVGNELAMQNRINLSIQMPHDRTSLLDIHADVFSGESPYQVVEWLPLVDVAKTKSMFILPRRKSEAVIARLREFGAGGMKALFDHVKDDLIWLTIPYGKLLIFCPNFLHGNVVNEEPTTRWSLNVRITGLFTPYVSAEKSLGAFYLPITPRPVTRLGMAYRQPGGFDE